MEFGRLLTAMVTPFDENLQINWEQVNRLVDYLIDVQATDTLVVSGTTGESPTLSDEEKLQLFAATVKHANGRAKIIAGTGSNDTAHAIHLSQKAQSVGVDALLLVTPYYNKTSQEGLFRHFEAIASSVDIPIMLYNVPSRSGINIDAKTTIRLSQIDNIVSVKESSGDLNQMAKIIANTTDDFTLYSGDDNLALPVLSIGGQGIVSVASHLVGSQMKEMIQLFLQGDHQLAAQKHRELLPVFTGIFTCPQGKSPAAVKYGLKYNNLDVGGVRLPMVDVSEDEMVFLQKLLSF